LPTPLPAVPAVLVVEEYDKLDCSMRGFFRQLLENAQVANVSANKCVGQHGGANWRACLRHRSHPAQPGAALHCTAAKLPCTSCWPCLQSHHSAGVQPWIHRAA
jgi:hypothetical protein